MTLKKMIERQQEILTAARAAGGLTAEQQAEFDSLQRSIDAARAAAPTSANGNAQQTAQDGAGQRAAQHKQNEPASDPEPAGGAGGAAGSQRNAEALAERQRILEISALCREFNVDPAQHIANGSTLDHVRTAILESLRTGATPIGAPAHGGNVSVAAAEEDRIREAASDGLMLRNGTRIEHPADGARDFSHMSLRDIAIDCMAREGRSERELRHMSNDDLYSELCRSFYNPASAFPAIMDATIRKSIVDLYSHVPTTFQEWTTEGSVSDFKSTPDHEYVIGGVGEFLLVPENGEIRADKPSTEILPSRKIETYGKSFSMTRQAFINDDIGFLTRVPGLYATKAKQTIDRQCYKLLFDNKPINFGDKKALFHADHKNLLATASGPSQAAIQAMILQMQKQVDQFGEPIYMTPSRLIVPVGYEFDLAVIFRSTQVTGSNNNDVNPLYNYPLGITQSPVLNALAGTGACPWYLKAADASARGIQVDYLNGQKTPTVRRMEAPGVLGFIWDIYLDWGISVRDYRGFVKNTGVKLG
ncbi:MAG: hypothetical protein PHV18_04330 [Lachnospiraceae bacterium]|nr:hypothetical protein [Lachnospiraceae bacterium]